MVFLALYVALQRVDRGLALIALTLALLGIAVFFATNNPFSMLSLSNQHAAAATDAERTYLLAAGQAILANTNQRAVGGFNMGLFLVSVAGLILSTVMLRSNAFGRPTAVVGILANALSLADYLRQALTSSPIVALLVILPNAPVLGDMVGASWPNALPARAAESKEAARASRTVRPPMDSALKSESCFLRIILL